MTDYDYHPPIRFQFDGDTDAAKQRIPQARALMQMLIRRMEAGGVEALNWRVNAADGTFFEIHKYGSQHVALIRSPIAPQPVLPTEEPIRLPISEGDGNYLWVGARLVFPDYSEDLYPTDTRPDGTSTVTTKWRDTPGETGEWRKYIGVEIAGFTDYSKAGYYEYPVDISSNVEEIPFISSIPTVNLVLFAPDAADQVAGSVFQSYDLNLGDVSSINQYLSIATAPSYSDQDKLTWWNTTATEYDERGWVVGDVPGGLADYYFGNNVWSNRGVYTSSLIYKKDNPLDAQTYLCLDTKDKEKTRQDYREPYLPNLGLPVQNLQNQIAQGQAEEVQSSTSGDPSGSYGTNVRTVTYTGVRMVTEAGSTVQIDEPSITQATDTDLKDGFYELRISAGFDQLVSYITSQANVDADGWRDVACEVFIQLGDTLRTYTVSLNATNSYIETMNFIDRGSSYDGPGTIGGLFDVRGWIEEGTPTTFDDTWYQGCWLIDIKNKTIIHETRPDRLERPWFTSSN